MTTNIHPTVSAADAAYLLRMELGDARNWSHFLADCIRREEKTFEGERLSPVAVFQTGRLRRPRYSVLEINDFIEKVKAINPSLGPAAIEVIELDVEESWPWVANKFNHAGYSLSRPARKARKH